MSKRRAFRLSQILSVLFDVTVTERGTSDARGLRNKYEILSFVCGWSVGTVSEASVAVAECRRELLRQLSWLGNIHRPDGMTKEQSYVWVAGLIAEYGDKHKVERIS